MKKLEWTSKAPTKGGWYWVSKRSWVSSGSNARVVRIDWEPQGYCSFGIPTHYFVKDAVKEGFIFAGPIMVPPSLPIPPYPVGY